VLNDHVASYTYDVDKEEWCEVCLKVGKQNVFCSLFVVVFFVVVFFVFQPNYAFNYIDLSGFSKINFPALCACFCVFCFGIWFVNEVRSDFDSSITLLGLRCMFFRVFMRQPMWYHFVGQLKAQ